MSAELKVKRGKPAVRSGRSPILKAADLDATRALFAQARTLPGVVFNSPEVFGLEQAELFGRMWLCVGRAADVPHAGDFFTHQIAGESIIIARGGDGVLRAFYNVCRHRGTRIVSEARGQGLRRLLCPYHAWSYDLDGSLQQAPRMPDNFRREDFPLMPVRLDLWSGFIFINLDESAETLQSCLADLPDLSRFHLAELQCGHRIEYEVAANWKLICENYSECYHCPGVHPQLARISDSISRSSRPQERGACFNGGPMLLRDGVETMSMSGKRTVPTIPGLSADDHRHVHYYVIYPNLLLSPHPDYVLTHTAWPLEPARTRIVCEWLFTPEAVNAPGFDPHDMVEFWDVTNRQDWALCEGAQLGTASRGYRPGPYHPAEDCVHTFDSWYAECFAALLRKSAQGRP
jgi:Rieske 2Fe-2S family protein